jgi:hypothetical protein
MTREITHMKAFTAALENMGKAPFSIGKIPPTPGLVDQYFNDSTGEGDEGETDARGPGTRATTGRSSRFPNSKRELKILKRRTSRPIPAGVRESKKVRQIGKLGNQRKLATRP